MEAAFFDLDKTVIAKASMVAFGRPLYRAGLVSRWLVLRAVWGQLVYLQLGHSEEQMEKTRVAVLRLTKGWDQAKVSAVVRDALDEVIEPIVYEEALDLIRLHREAGRKVFIVSASPIEVVAPLATYLGVDDAIATRARIDEEGRYTGEVEFSSHGTNKVLAMEDLAERHGLDLSASYAYSDSATDLPMLEAVGHPVAVNPDRELRRAATERGWEIQVFGREVPLRRRVPMPSPAQTAAGAAGLTGVGAAAVAWWWLRRDHRAGRGDRAPSGLAGRIGVAGPKAGHRADQTVRTFLAATAARATRTTRRSSFFMGRSIGARGGGRRPGARSPRRGG